MQRELQSYRLTVVFLHSYIFIWSGFQAVFIPANKLLQSNKLVCIYEIKNQSCYDREEKTPHLKFIQSGWP